MADIIDLIKGNDLRPNPDYNPKTKKGSVVSPYLVNTDSNKLNDFASKVLNIPIMTGYGLTQYGNPDLYADYDVTLNPVNTQEEIDKERANNQSHFAQVANGIGRTVNEMTTGTVVGTLDLASVLIDAIKNDGLKYERPEFIQWFDDFKNSIDEKLPIYRENPNSAFDLTDIAWWMENMPSVASTISLMVPGVGAAKAIGKLGSLIAKGAKLTKAGQKASKLIKLGEKSKALIAKGVEATTSGTTMRLLENYQEAMQTKQDAFQFAKEQLNSMDDKKREEFLANNPNYVGKSDDEIAESIALNSADKTFATDWFNVVFDIAQVYGLKNMWSKAMQGNKTAALTKLNKKVALQFGDDAAAIEKSLAGQTLGSKVKENITDLGKDILTGARAEWTEGIEEAVNYIAQEKGMELAKLAFDKNTDTKTISDYIKDPHLWESAFWGVLGGVGFSVVGDKAIGIAQRKFNKEFLSGEEQRKNEIIGRSATFQEYQNALSQIANGKNPYMSDNKTNTPKDIETDEERDALKELAKNNYLDNMVINAINNNNIELLEEFSKDINIAKGFKEKLNLNEEEAIKTQQDLQNRISTTKDIYLDTVNKAFDAGASYDQARIIASETVNANNTQRLNKTLQQYTDNLFNNILNKDGITIENSSLQAINNIVYFNRLHSLRQQRTILETQDESYGTKERIADLNKKISILENNAPVGYLNENGISNDKENNELAKEIQQKYPKEFNTIYSKYDNDLTVKMNEDAIDLSIPTLKKRVNKLKDSFDIAKNNIINNALAKYDELYRKYGNDITNTDNITDETDKNQLDTINKILKTSDVTPVTLADRRKAIDETKDLKDRYEATEPIVEEPAGEVIGEDSIDKNNQTDESSTGKGNNENNPLEIAETEDAPDVTDTTDVPETTDTTQNQPPVEDVQGQSQTDNAKVEQQEEQVPTEATKINLIEQLSEQDYNERLEEDIIDFVASNALDTIIDINEFNTHKEEYINIAIAKGYAKEDAEIAFDNFAGGLFGDYIGFDDNGMAFSTINENDIVIQRLAMLSIIDKNLRNNGTNIEKLLDTFVSMTDDKGISFGKTIKDKTYINIESLNSYIYNIAGLPIIADFLFTRLKSYLLSNKNNRFIATDRKEFINLSSKEASNRIKSYAINRQLSIKRYMPNNVNISVNDIEEQQNVFNNIIKLKPNEEINYTVSNDGRIYLTTNDAEYLGYLGIPTYDEHTGIYTRVNRHWQYDLYPNKDGNVVSKLKDFITDVLTNGDEEFLNNLYQYVFDKKNDELAFAIYNNLVDYGAIEQGFLNVDNSDYAIKNEYILDAIEHFANIASHTINNPTEIKENINSWFNKLANSYTQAIAISKKEVKGNFTVQSINKGILALSEKSDNNIEEVIDDYNEESYPLATITGYNTVQFANEQQPRIIPGFSQIGATILIVPNANGGFDSAQCAKPYFKDMNNKEANELKEAASIELYNILTNFVSSNNLSINNILDDISKLIGNNGLFANISFIHNVKDNGESLAFYYSDSNEPVDENGRKRNKWLFSINNTTRGVGYRNIVINKESNTFNTNNSDIYYRSNIINENKDKLKHKEIKEAISVLFNNSHVNVPFSFANDSKLTTLNRKYIRRENGRTYIEIGDYKKDYNSYSDFLISNKFIKTKLRKTNDDDGIHSGNYIFDSTVGLDVIFNDNSFTIEETIKDIKDEFDIDEFKRLTENNKTNIALRDIFKGNPKIQQYIDTLQRLNVLPATVNIEDSITDNGRTVFASYDYNTKEISINANAFSEHSYDWGIRRLVHESLHEQLDTIYTRREALDKIKTIYDKYVDYVKQNEADNADYNKFINIVPGNEDMSIEEFMVESITNSELMTYLNNIKSDTDNKKSRKRSLLAELLKTILDILGININDDSLLAEELNILKDIKPNKKKSAPRKGLTNINRTAIAQQEISLTDTNDFGIIEETDNDIFPDNDDDFFGANDAFSSIDEKINATNLPNLIDSQPIPLRASISKMLTNGDLYMMCT